MPDLNQNIATWNAGSSWVADGEEWSGPWEHSESQWWGTLMPRLHAFLPTGTALELGPGHGRWTQYLKELCNELILVDLAESCIEACRARFSTAQNLSYRVTDGKSLPGVPDRSVDFVFSFDSLVHAEADVLAAYAGELARVLKPDGIGVIHHSNMGALRRQAVVARAIPERARRPLVARGLLINTYAWRAETPSAARFARDAQAVGLTCVAQEKIAWHFGRHLTDVISTVTPAGSKWERPNIVVSNPRLMSEARASAAVARLYSAASFTDGQPPADGALAARLR